MSAQISFPVGIPATWTEPKDTFIPDHYLKNWLLDTGSLTERLQSHCRRFSLQLLGQRCVPLAVEELQHMQTSDGSAGQHHWQVREVILSGEASPWVFARSILPDALCQQDLATLGEQPLGKIIFNDPRFVRSPFQLTRILPDSGFLQRLGIQQLMPLWGRRSVFSFESHRMMVAEVFLPDAPAYKQLPQPFHYD